MGADPVLGVAVDGPPQGEPMPEPEPPTVHEPTALEMEASTPEMVVEAIDLLSTLFDAHYRSLCRLAFVLLGDGAQAEDVVQDAFLRTFTGFGRLRDRGRASGAERPKGGATPPPTTASSSRTSPDATTSICWKRCGPCRRVSVPPSSSSTTPICPRPRSHRRSVARWAP
jgi:Sigma-70 region 2